MVFGVLIGLVAGIAGVAAEKSPTIDEARRLEQEGRPKKAIASSQPSLPWRMGRKNWP
jgi:hypothetical protein